MTIASRNVIMFQSTRPARGATSVSTAEMLPNAVSIHAPRAGRDRFRRHCSRAASSFNPRAPCGARRNLATLPLLQSFNPRAPRGARRSPNVNPICGKVSIHAPRVGRDGVEIAASGHLGYDVSIHAPRVGRDINRVHKMPRAAMFQSTRPRGARPSAIRSNSHVRVSIHAPLWGATRGH